MALSKVIIPKQPGETRLVTMSFSNKMVTGELITAINSITQTLADGSATTDLEFTDSIYSGQSAQFLVSGGVIPSRPDITYTDYKVTVTVTTDDGQILENDGILKVQET